MTDRDPLYRRRRLPVEIIAHAVWLHFRFPLSLRMVEDMLAAGGIIVSHQTVRLWAEKFGRTFANEIRSRSCGRLGDKRHPNEAVVSIGDEPAGENHSGMIRRGASELPIAPRPSSLRYLGNYIAIQETASHGVTIVAIVHARRDPSTWLE